MIAYEAIHICINLFIKSSCKRFSSSTKGLVRSFLEEWTLSNRFGWNFYELLCFIWLILISMLTFKDKLITLRALFNTFISITYSYKIIMFIFKLTNFFSTYFAFWASTFSYEPIMLNISFKYLMTLATNSTWAWSFLFYMFFPCFIKWTNLAYFI